MMLLADGATFSDAFQAAVTGAGAAAVVVATVVQSVRKGNRKTRGTIRAQNLMIEWLWAYVYKLRQLLSRKGIPVPPPDEPRLAREIEQGEDDAGNDLDSRSEGA